MGLIKGTINNLNMSKICKICLEEKPNTFSLLSLLVFKDISLSPININNILMKVAPKTELLENGPSLICHNCMDELKTSYLLLLKYEEAVDIIQKYLETQLKEEIVEVEEINLKICEESESETVKRYDTRSSIKRQKRRGRKRKFKLENEENSSKHNDEKMHPCPICTKEFSVLDLVEHAHTHKALKKYLSIPEDCKVALGTRFSTQRHLTSPQTSFFNRAEKLHKCPYCNLDFFVSDFRLHIQMHRIQDEFKCDKCDRVFRKLNHLNTHRVKHLKEFPYKCEQCGKGFVIKRNYDCHILTHKNEELPHECKFCFKRFSNPEHLNRHQIIHTENVSYAVKYRVCKCYHCLKSFKSRSDLKLHICVPIEQAVNTRFPCKTCNKVFKHSSGLYNHNRNIHKLKGAKTLCSVCGKYVSNIYNHMMRHTGEKRYQCNQCDKKFMYKPQLKQHLLVHSGLKPYVCSVCAKAFNNLYNLQVHERMHKGDRCHICTICNKGFLEKSYLKKHMNVHTKV